MFIFARAGSLVSVPHSHSCLFSSCYIEFVYLAYLYISPIEAGGGGGVFGDGALSCLCLCIRLGPGLVFCISNFRFCCFSLSCIVCASYCVRLYFVILSCICVYVCVFCIVLCYLFLSPSVFTLPPPKKRIVMGQCLAPDAKVGACFNTTTLFCYSILLMFYHDFVVHIPTLSLSLKGTKRLCRSFRH